MSKCYQLTLLLSGTLLVCTPVLAEDDGDGPRRDGRHGQQQSFDELDQNGDGLLSFEEFVAGHMQRLNERFRRIDQDEDGALSEEEVKEAHKKHRRRGNRRRGEQGPPPDEFQE